MDLVKIFIKPIALHPHQTTKAEVLKACEDRAAGNFEITSRAILQKRLSEIWSARQSTDHAFKEFEKRFWKVAE